MFDVGWSELVVIGVVSLVVIGPKELPGVIRNVGRAVGKLRTMAGDFRAQFDEAMREADLAEVQKTFSEAKDVAAGAMQAATNPVGAIKDEIVSSVSSINDSARALEADMKGAEPAAPLPLVDLPPLPELPPVVIPTEEVAEAKPRRTRKKAEEAPEPAEPAVAEAPKPKRARKKAADEGAA